MKKINAYPLNLILRKVFRRFVIRANAQPREQLEQADRYLNRADAGEFQMSLDSSTVSLSAPSYYPCNLSGRKS